MLPILFLGPLLSLASHLGALPPAVPLAEPAAPAPAPLALVVADEDIGKGWTGAVALGLSTSSGNTVRTGANATGDARLRREGDRITLGAFWSFAQEEDDDGNTNVTERRYGGRSKYDYFLTERSYLLANASAEADNSADLQLRATGGLGYGYQWIEEEMRAFSTELGLNWFHEDLEGESPNEYLAARAAYDALYRPNERLTFNQLAEIYPSLEDGDDIFTKLDTRARYSFSDVLFTQAQWVWDWNNTPAEGRERSDHRFFLTLGFSF